MTLYSEGGVRVIALLERGGPLRRIYFAAFYLDGAGVERGGILPSGCDARDIDTGELVFAMAVAPVAPVFVCAVNGGAKHANALDENVEFRQHLEVVLKETRVDSKWGVVLGRLFDRSTQGPAPPDAAPWMQNDLLGRFVVSQSLARDGEILDVAILSNAADVDRSAQVSQLSDCPFANRRFNTINDNVVCLPAPLPPIPPTAGSCRAPPHAQAVHAWVFDASEPLQDVGRAASANSALQTTPQAAIACGGGAFFDGTASPTLLGELAAIELDDVNITVTGIVVPHKVAGYNPIFSASLFTKPHDELAIIINDAVLTLSGRHGDFRCVDKFNETAFEVEESLVVSFAISVSRRQIVCALNGRTLESRVFEDVDLETAAPYRSNSTVFQEPTTFFIGQEQYREANDTLVLTREAPYRYTTYAGEHFFGTIFEVQIIPRTLSVEELAQITSFSVCSNALTPETVEEEEKDVNVGLAVGLSVLFVCLLLAAIVGFVLWRRHRQKSANNINTTTSERDATNMVDLEYDFPPEKV